MWARITDPDNFGHVIMLIGFVLICAYLGPHIVRAVKKEKASKNVS